MSYPSHLEARLRAIRLCMARYGRLPSLHDVWRQVIVDQLTIRREEVTEEAIGALATTLDREAIVVFGVLYPNAKAACNAHRVDDSAVRWRMRHCAETLAQAITYLAQPRVTVFGTDYPSIDAVCKAYGISRSTLHFRMRRGETLEQAIAHLKQSTRTAKSVTVFGLTHKTTSAACKAHGLRQGVVWTRMRDCGETLEQAITHLKQFPVVIEPATVFGMAYKSTAAACKAHGTGVTPVRYRMKSCGETLEQAITHLKNANVRKPGVVFGTDYPSVNSACRAHGVSQPSVWHRMKKYGETLEQAITRIKDTLQKPDAVFGDEPAA